MEEAEKPRPFSVAINWNGDLLDEICLEGLEGVTVEQLWERLAVRWNETIPDSLKPILWNNVSKLREVEMFQLPKRRDIFRLQIKPDELAETRILNFDETDRKIYPFSLIKDQNGSCQYYNERINVTETVRKLSFAEITEKWDRNLVLVGSAVARWNSLAPQLSPSMHSAIKLHQYCLLERIGRLRYNGTTTYFIAGGNESKMMFYHRKMLLDLNLIKKQTICVSKNETKLRSFIVLQLTRFYKDYQFLSLNNPALNALIEKLKKSDEVMTLPSAINFIRSIDPSMVLKKLYKHLKYYPELQWNLPIKYREIVSSLKEEDRNDTLDENDSISIVRLKEEEKSSEDEIDESVSNIGYHERLFNHRENILPQFYSCVREAGTKGLYLNEICTLMGFNRKFTYYVCRILLSYKLFHIVLVDNKKQRKARFIAQEFAKQAIDDLNGKSNMNESTDSKPPIKMNPGPSNTIKRKRVAKNTWSVLQKKRMDFILENLNSRQVMYLNFIPKMCTLHEKGKNGSVDKKSIKKIINYLHDTAQLKIHNIKIAENDTLVLISKPDIDPEHDLIKSIISNRQLHQKSLTKIIPIRQTSEKLLNQESSKLDGHLPRFWKCRSLHEYLFYLAYHHSYSDSDQVISDCNTEIYEKFKNVPPLKRHNNWSKGWLFFSDAISYIPLSLLMKIQRAAFVVPGLSEYLKHPDKKHILVKDLPLDLRSILMHKRLYIARIFVVLEQLVCMGLVQMGERTMKEKDKMYIYINQRISITNTTSSSPSYNMIEEKEYPKEYFTFKTIDDINEYWNHLQSICLSTHLGERDKIKKEVSAYIPTNEKLKSYLSPHSKANAEEFDTGDIPGDGRGAGGLDSSFYSHLKKSWAFTLNPDMGHVTGIKVKNIKCLMPSDKKVARKYPKLPRFIGKFVKKDRLKKRTIAVRKPVVKKEIQNDSIDEEILKTSQHPRAKWTAEETKILLLTQVVMSFMCPQKLIYFSTLIRDILRVMTGIYDKTSKACQRRLHFMTKTPKLVRNKQIFLAEILSCPAIKNRYYNIYTLKKVPPGSPSFSQFEYEMKIYLVELFHILHVRIYGGNKAHKASIILPKTYSDLQQDFSIELPEEKIQSSSTQLVQIENNQDIKEALAHNVIHSVLYCSSEKNYKEENLLTVYLKHSEEALRAALTKMRKLGIISLRKLSSHKNPISAASAFNYNFSQSYIYQLCRDVPYTIFSQVYENIENINKSGKFESFANNLDVQSGTVATIIELLSLKVISIDLTIPSEIRIINSKSISKSKCENEIDDSNDSIDANVLANNDFFMIKACHFEPYLNCSANHLRQITQTDIQWTSNLVVNDAVIEFDDNLSHQCSKFLNEKPKIYSSIYEFIKDGKELGVNSSDIKNAFSSNKGLFNIIDIIKILSKEKLIYRVGYVKNHWITWEYTNIWSVQKIKLKSDIILKKRKSDMPLPEALSKQQKRFIEQNVGRNESTDNKLNPTGDMIRIFPRPWIRPNGTLCSRVLWRWIGSIVCHLALKSAVRLKDLQIVFNYMIPFHMRILAEYATKFGCTEMFVLKHSRESLFTESKIEKSEASILDDEEDIFIEIMPNALLKFATMKAKALSEIIEPTSSNISMD